MEVFRFEQKTHAYLDYFDNPIGVFFSVEKHSPTRHYAIVVLRERLIEMISKRIVQTSSVHIVIFGGVEKC